MGTPKSIKNAPQRAENGQEKKRTKKDLQYTDRYLLRAFLSFAKVQWLRATEKMKTLKSRYKLYIVFRGTET